MNDENRAKEIFQKALDKPAERRAAYLDRVCAEPALRARVDALLDAFEGLGEFLDEPTAAPAPPMDEGPGTTIGPYKLLQEIGAGGFGVVYMAEQIEPVRRKVALKIIRLGMDSRQVVARFEAERQALALMDHKNIAKALDAGTTESGRPYFVMELVKGIPITQYCNQARIDTRGRLELFQDVCHAVQHAHQKGIIHRDIKPSNVLVTLHDGRPVPKVIDFGIAKAIDRSLTDKTLFTEFRQWIGTPDYMAPEQAELSGLDIDTRADVYSLGVLLYELLTGTKPFDLKTLMERGFDEILRTIREVDPQRPSTRVSTMGEQLATVAKDRHTPPRLLGKLLRGELDWIVMKALEKDRQRRYETAHGFALDVGRYLADEPVRAMPPSARYRFAKYVRRHRVGATVALTIAGALLVGSGVAYAGMREARRESESARNARAAAAERRADAEAAAKGAREQRERAEVGAKAAKDEKARADGVLRYTSRVLGASDPFRFRGPKYKVHDLLKDFDREIGSGAPEDPAVEAMLRVRMAASYLGLGLPDEAESHIDRALAIRRRLFGEDSLEHAGALIYRGRFERDKGRYKESVATRRAVLAAHLRHSGDGACATGLARAELAESLRLTGALTEAEQQARAALSIQRRVHGGDHEHVASVLYRLGGIAMARGDFREAQPRLREALAIQRRLFGPSNPVIAHALSGLADATRMVEGPGAAEPLLREALKIAREGYGEAHAGVATLLNNLGATLRAKGDLDGAEEAYRRAAEVAHAAFGERHPAYARVLGNQGRLAKVRGDFVAAERLHRRQLRILREALGPDHPEVAACLNGLGLAVRGQGRFEEAEALHEQAVTVSQKAYRDGSPYRAVSLTHLAVVLLKRGKLERAETSARQAVAILRAGKVMPSMLADALNTLGTVLSRQSEEKEALELYREALDVHRGVVGEGNAGELPMLANLARTLFRTGQRDAAERTIQEAWAVAENVLPKGHPQRAWILDRMAEFRADHDPAAALRLAERAWAIRRAAFSDDHVETASSRNAIALILFRLNRMEEAADHLRSSAPVYLSRFGADHWRTVVTLHNLAYACVVTNDYPGAEKAVLAIPEARRTVRHRGWLVHGLNRQGKHAAAEVLARRLLAEKRGDDTLALLGETLLLLRKHAEAEPVLRECLALREKTRTDTWLHYNAMSLVGAALAGLERYDEAEPLLLDAWRKMKTPPSVAFRRTEALDRIVALYEEWGKKDEAVRWRAKR